MAGQSPREYHILPVEPAGVAGSSEVFQPKKEEIALLVKRVLAGAVPPTAMEGRGRVEIRNGKGGTGVAQSVASRLIPAGYEVVLTGNADNFSHATTDVVFYDDALEPKARDVVRLLGVGNLVLNRFPSGVADITIIVGKDFP